MRYALYEQIAKGYAMRIGVYATYEIALNWMEDISCEHSIMFIEAVKS